MLVWMLALGLDGGRVMLVDESTGEKKWAVQAHPTLSGRTKVAMSPGNGRFVASVGIRDASFKLWDAEDGWLHMVGTMHDGTGACICEVNKLSDKVVQEGCPAVAHTRGIVDVAFSPCGQRLATGGEDGVVIVWDAQTGEVEHRMKARRSAEHVRFSADGARLACGSTSGFIYVWDATTGALLRTMPADRSGDLTSLNFSPTENCILATCGKYSIDYVPEYHRIQIWDVDSGAKLRSIEGGVFAVFSPDGRTIATAGGSQFRDVILLDAKWRSCSVQFDVTKFSLQGHTKTLCCASWSLDGSKLASGSRDGTCKVWDSSTGALLRTIRAQYPVLSVVWARDWVQDTQSAMAFAMGHHPRLGVGSQLLELEVGVVRMILDRV